MPGFPAIAKYIDRGAVPMQLATMMGSLCKKAQERRGLMAGDLSRLHSVCAINSWHTLAYWELTTSSVSARYCIRGTRSNSRCDELETNSSGLLSNTAEPVTSGMLIISRGPKSGNKVSSQTSTPPRHLRLGSLPEQYRRPTILWPH